MAVSVDVFASAEENDRHRLEAVFRASPSDMAPPPPPPYSKLIGWSGNVPEFEQGVSAMRRGEYRVAVDRFKSAVAAAPGGSSARLTGHYTIWLANALHAAGDEAAAAALLERCRSTHSDDDVRRVATDVLAIQQAPPLKLQPTEFIAIQPLQPDGGWRRPAAPAEPIVSAQPERRLCQREEAEGASSGAGAQRGEVERRRGVVARIALLVFVLVIADPVVWWWVLEGRAG